MAEEEGKNLQLNHQQQDASANENNLEKAPVQATFQPAPFPEGGARAWSVAIGAAGVLFCTFGYVNAFG